MKGPDGATRKARERRRQALTFVAGLLLISLLIGTVIVIFDAFSGKFSSYVAVRADLPLGQPIEPRSAVQFRQVQVGQVGGVGRTLPGGAIEVTLQIKPAYLRSIPAGVTAIVVPSSLFGTETVVLQDPTPGARPGHLLASQTIPAAGGSASLQGTLTDLDKFLTGLHPAQIDSSLNALSGALQGQGPALTDSVRALNSYMDNLIPQLPALNGDIDLLTPVLNGLSASVPALLDVAVNSGTVAQTLSQDQTLIGALLSEGSQVAGTGSTLLSSVRTSMHSFLANLEPMMADMAAQPNLPATIINDLNSLTTSFLPALSGPMAGASVQVTSFVYSPYEAYMAGSNQPGVSERQDQQEAHDAFRGTIDPPTYTAADCPRYASEPGPNCPGVSAAAVETSAQQSSAAQLFAGLAGHPSTSATVDDVILAPLLESLAS